MHIIHLFYSRGFDSECGFMWRFWKNRISHDPLPKWHSDERQLSGVSRKTLFWSCVWSWENKESVYVLCAPHFRVCVCVCVWWPTVNTVRFSSPRWDDSGWTGGAQCDLPKHTAATPTVNSVWSERRGRGGKWGMKETGAEWKREEDRTKEREGGEGN